MCVCIAKKSFKTWQTFQSFEFQHLNPCSLCNLYLSGLSKSDSHSDAQTDSHSDSLRISKSDSRTYSDQAGGHFEHLELHQTTLNI